MKSELILCAFLPRRHQGTGIHKINISNHFCVIWCFSVFVAILSSFESQAQSITTGQTGGEKITYHDIDDISIESSFWWDSDWASLDLNDNGTNDADFWTNWIYYSHPESQALAAGANLQASIEFSTELDNPTWIKKHAVGEVIDNTLNWMSGDEIFYTSSTGGNSGSFSGEGYIAYRIISPDTTFGWIHVKREVISDTRLTIYEFAYITYYMGVDEKNILENCRITISGNKLRVDLPGDNSSFLIQIFDLTGRSLYRHNLASGEQIVDMQGFCPGMMIVRVEDEEGRFISRKVLKSY
jgi:hypothetical protein